MIYGIRPFTGRVPFLNTKVCKENIQKKQAIKTSNKNKR